MALVLCVAFVGTAKVARALGVRSDLACIVAGFAFALSPRMLTVLGPSSIEVVAERPGALGAAAPRDRRRARLSASGRPRCRRWRSRWWAGVNAAATSAVLPLGVLWLLTREPGPRRRSMMLWWPVFTVLGTLWWLVPLFLLGAYSPPFLDFIETAAVTTYPTTLFDALRGTSNWVPYVDPDCARRHATSSPRSTCPSTARSSWRPVSRAWRCGATRTACSWSRACSRASCW